jgi:hypothetical protein
MSDPSSNLTTARLCGSAASGVPAPTCRLEPDNHILAAAIDGCDALALQLGRDLDAVERARQPRIGDLDAFEGAAHEHRLEPATDGLDLRELGHRTSVVAGGVRDAAIVGVAETA